MVSCDRDPSHVMVQLIVTSNGIVFSCNTNGSSFGNTNTGVENGTSGVFV